MSDKDPETLERELEKHYGWYDSGTRMWSTAHHTTLFMVPILTAVATVLVKVHPDGDLQIVLTTAATVLASIAASQGFAKKWQANRISRSRLDELRIEMTEPKFDRTEIRTKLIEVIRQHEEGILGAENSGEHKNRDKADKNLTSTDRQ